MSHIDFAPYEVEVESRICDEETWWVLLLVNANHATHTKIEITSDVSKFWMKTIETSGKTWQVGVYVRPGHRESAEAFAKELSESTLRGQLSRAVVFEQVAKKLNYEVYNYITPLLQVSNAENLIERQTISQLPRHKQRKKK